MEFHFQVLSILFIFDLRIKPLKLPHNHDSTTMLTCIVILDIIFRIITVFVIKKLFSAKKIVFNFSSKFFLD